MSNAFPELTLDETAFMRATQNVADLEYEYVIRMVGQEGLINDITQKNLARTAVTLLDSAHIELFQDNEGLVFNQTKHLRREPFTIPTLPQ